MSETVLTAILGTRVRVVQCPDATYVKTSEEEEEEVEEWQENPQLLRQVRSRNQTSTTKIRHHIVREIHIFTESLTTVHHRE